MNSPDSQVIIERFFKALYHLKKKGAIKGKKTFTDRYDINRWNLNSLEKDLRNGNFKTEWLFYLVRDYNINPDWLLTGRGEMEID